MDYLIVGLRLLHIVSAVLWVGMMFLTVFFLMPSIQDAGPDGGKVMAALQRRGLMNFIPAVALIALITGAWLYWRASLGMDAAYVHSATGGAFAIGGFAAIVAYVLGITIVRPSMMRAMAIMQTIGSAAGDEERQRRMGEVERLRARSRTGGRVVASLLLFATVAMAVARYL